MNVGSVEGFDTCFSTVSDLLFDRLEEASESLPDCTWINANGQDLPFKDESFDLAIQFTAFSSVLDPEIKRDMAEAMLRVLKPDGGVLWYDFIPEFPTFAKNGVFNEEN